MKGKFITLEGPDGSGKTTVSKIVVEQLQMEGYKVLLTREPGGIDIAEQIRKIILDTNNIIQCVSQNVDNKFIGQKYTSTIPDTKSIKKTDNYKWVTSDFSNTFDGAKYSIVYNIIISNRKIGTIILGYDRGNINQTLLQEYIVILIFVLVINIVGFFFLRMFIDRALSPIKEISDVTAEIASGNFSKRIKIGNRMDEISILARNLNSMAA